MESERITQEIQKRKEREGQDGSQMNLKGMVGYLFEHELDFMIRIYF